ncbi:MAG: T9SS type A sorting domain-containing protein [Bacteroidota bacterium]
MNLKLICTIVVLWTSSCLQCLAQSFDWVISGGASLSDAVTDLEIGPQGNIYICGDVQGSNGSFLGQNVSTTQNRNDGFVAKISPSGSLIWYKQIMSTGDGQDEAYNLGVDEFGNCYVIGEYEYTLFFDGISLPPNPGEDEGFYFAKINSNGVWQWAVNVLSNEVGYFYSVTVDSQNDILVGGKNDSGDAMVIKFDPTGSQEWVYNTSSTFELSRITGISIDSNNDIYCLGRFKHDITFGAQTFQVNGSDLFDQDAFVAKISSNGIFQWFYQIGGEEDVSQLAIDIDINNNAYFGVVVRDDTYFDNTLIPFESGFTVVIAKISPNQELLEYFEMPHTPSSLLLTLDVTDQNDLFIGANFSDDTLNINGQLIMPTNGSVDGFVCKYDEVNGLQWFQSFGGSDVDICRALEYDDSGFLYFGGELEGTSTFGDITINPNDIDNQDLFLTKYQDCDSPQPIISYDSDLLICKGSVIELSVNEYENAIYQWYDENGLIVGANQPLLLANSAGIYYVNISLGGTCNANSEAVEIEVESPEVELLTTDYEICPQNDVTQIFTNVPFVSYQWSTGATDPILEVYSPGTYSVIATTSNGCNATDAIIIESMDAPESPVLSFADCILSADSSNFQNVNYIWAIDNISVTNNFASINANVFGNGTYVLSVEGVNGCISSSPQLIVANCGFTSVEELENNNDIIIIPNPTTGEIYLKGLNTNFLNNINSISFFSANGIPLMEVSSSSILENKFDISSFENGIYFIRLELDNFSLSKKIIKIR